MAAFLISLEVANQDIFQEVEGLPHDGYSVRGSVSMSWNIYDGGEKRAEIDIKRKELRKSRIQLRDRKERVKEDVITVLNNIEELKRQLETLTTSVESSRRNLEELQALYDNDKATMTEVVDARTDLLMAESNMNKARYSLLTAY